MHHIQDKLGKTYDRVFYIAVIVLATAVVGFGFFCAGA